MISTVPSITTWCKSSYSGTQVNCIEVAWRKSTHSGTEPNCVEVATVADVVAIRDSKQASGPVLSFSRNAFAAFIHAAKAEQVV